MLAGFPNDRPIDRHAGWRHGRTHLWLCAEVVDGLRAQRWKTASIVDDAGARQLCDTTPLSRRWTWLVDAAGHDVNRLASAIVQSRLRLPSVIFGPFFRDVVQAAENVDGVPCFVLHCLAVRQSAVSYAAAAVHSRKASGRRTRKNGTSDSALYHPSQGRN